MPVPAEAIHGWDDGKGQILATCMKWSNSLIDIKIKKSLHGCISNPTYRWQIGGELRYSNTFPIRVWSWTESMNTRCALTWGERFPAQKSSTHLIVKKGSWNAKVGDEAQVTWVSGRSRVSRSMVHRCEVSSSRILNSKHSWRCSDKCPSESEGYLLQISRVVCFPFFLVYFCSEFLVLFEFYYFKASIWFHITVIRIWHSSKLCGNY